MLSLRSRQISQTPLNPSHSNDEKAQTQNNDQQTISDYEQTREERIKQNLAKMQKLGIFDLSLKLKSTVHQNRGPKNQSQSQSRVKTPPLTPPLQHSGPIRRSSRLKNSTPVSYSEVDLKKKDKALGKEDILPEVGSRPEMYTEEHEKLLGNTEKTWTLFVDGYGRDGKRIYDPVKGKTCHQCRQKTLGYRTHCSQCNMVQGQFCGDCLYMRYGEHVLEARENPKWICPVCRGICNCSLCRQAKGWAPTGTLYKKISQLGFKSVAHYLIQTCRLETNQGNKQDPTNEVPVKRSLPFSDMGAVPDDSHKVTNDQHDSTEEFQDKSNDEFKNSDDNPKSAKRSLPFLNMGLTSENIGFLEVDDRVEGHNGSSNHQYPNKRDDNIKSEKKEEMHEIECSNSDTAFKSSSKLHMEPAQATESSIEGIAGKLRQSCEKSNGYDDDLPEAEEKKKVLDGKQAEEEMDQENDSHFICTKHESVKKIPLKGTPKVKDTSLATTINSDSIAGRLKRRHLKSCDHDDEKNSDVKHAVEGVSLQNEVEKQNEALTSDIKHHGDGNALLETSPKLKLTRVLASEPSTDSIAGRLRQRRRMGSHDDEKLGLLEQNSGTLQAANHLSESASSEPMSESIAAGLRPKRRTI